MSDKIYYLILSIIALIGFNGMIFIEPINRFYDIVAGVFILIAIYCLSKINNINKLEKAP